MTPLDVSYQVRLDDKALIAHIALEVDRPHVLGNVYPQLVSLCDVFGTHWTYEGGFWRVGRVLRRWRVGGLCVRH